MSDKNYHDEHKAAWAARRKEMTPKQLDRLNKIDAIEKKHMKEFDADILEYLDKMQKVLENKNE